MLIEPGSAPVTVQRLSGDNSAIHPMRYLSALVHNAVPLAGVLFFDWSVLNLLAVFWFDSLAQGLFDSMRIGAHRRLTNDPAHKTGAVDHSGRRFQWVGPPVGRGSFLAQHARSVYPVIAFCGAALVVLTTLNLAGEFDLQDFVYGAASVALLAAIEFIADLRHLGQHSFLWLQHRVGAHPISLLVVTLLVGVPVALWFGTMTAAYVMLVVIKTLADWGGIAHEDYSARHWPAGWDRLG